MISECNGGSEVWGVWGGYCSRAKRYRLARGWVVKVTKTYVFIRPHTLGRVRKLLRSETFLLHEEAVKYAREKAERDRRTEALGRLAGKFLAGRGIRL